MEWLYQVSIPFNVDNNQFKPENTEIKIGYALGLYQSSSDGPS